MRRDGGEMRRNVVGRCGKVVVGRVKLMEEGGVELV